MGQQQILFVILAVCVIAIAVSLGVLSLNSATMSDNRSLVEQDLALMTRNIQYYVNRPVEEDGGGVSFDVLRRLPNALERAGCPTSNAHGDYFVRKGADALSMQVVGVGIEAGYDQTRPLRMVMTIWADSSALTVQN
jgi:hypothetical protein